MTGVFTGALAIALGLGLLAGPARDGDRHGARLPRRRLPLDLGPPHGNRPAAELADGVRRRRRSCPPRCSGCRRSRGTRSSGCSAARRWRCCWAFPFWVAVLIVLGVQGVVGFFGYEVIHRLQAVLTVVLFVTFVVFAVKLVGGHDVVTPPTVHGADLVGAFVLEVTIALSLTVSWASYASDFSRYLPADIVATAACSATRSPGSSVAYVFVQGIGVAAGELVSEQTAEGVRSVMGGGLLGGAGPAGHRAGVRRFGRDERLQRVAGTADARRARAQAAVLGGGDGAGVRADPVAALRRHRGPVPERAAVRQLLDSRVRRGGRRGLADPQPGPDRRRPRRRAAPHAPMPWRRWWRSSSPTPRRSRS